MAAPEPLCACLRHRRHRPILGLAAMGGRLHSVGQLVASSTQLPVPIAPAAGTLRLLVYSGDIDGIVPVTGSRRWVADSLGLVVSQPWRPWTSGPSAQGGRWWQGVGFNTTFLQGAGIQPWQAQVVLCRAIVAGLAQRGLRIPSRRGGLQ